MGDLIDFSHRKPSKSKAFQSDLELVTSILTQNFQATEKAAFVREVKGVLRSRGVAYRVSHKEVSVKVAPKKSTILFDVQKIGFVLGGAHKTQHLANGWTIMFVKLKREQTPVYLTESLLQKLSEVSNGN